MSVSESTVPTGKRQRRKWKRRIAIVLATLLLLRIAVGIIPARIEIGPETTFIDGPVREDGSIDYAAALDDEWSAGVTPDQNAAVDIIRAFGPEIIDLSIRDEYFERLGIPIPPPEGDYFIEFPMFLKAQGLDGDENAERFAELEDQFKTTYERPWTAEEFPEVAAWLEANQKPLDAILDASRRPRFYSPSIAPDQGLLLEALLPTAQKERAAARMLVVKAMFEIARNEIHRARDLAAACHRLSALTSEYPVSVGKMLSLAIDAVATAAGGAIVVSGQLYTTIQVRQTL